MKESLTGSRGKPLAFVVLAALGALALVHTMHRCGQIRARTAPSIALESKHAHFTIYRDGRIHIETNDGARNVDAEIVVDDDEGTRPVALADLSKSDDSHASAGVATFVVDGPRDALDIAFTAPDAGDAEVGVRIPTDGRSVFLSARGELGDLVTDSGRFAVVEDLTHPLGLTAGGEPMNVEIEQLESADGGRARSALRVTRSGKDMSLTLAIGNASGVWPVLFDRAKIETKKVKGTVVGVTGSSHVVGLDDDGAPQIRVATDPAGHFEFTAPTTVTSFYASASATRTSAPVIYAPGSDWPLRLDVSDGGELHVRAFDADTHAPITARLVVHGIDGTLDPSFGPDYRASGAGPIIDALRGDVTTPLPAGKYRIAVTKGITWSIDTRIVDIEPGKRVEIDLSPRHVVKAPGELGCDLHVHARPSFDAPVTPEDRVLSLVASGVDFAVPTEHNLIGNYGPSIKLLALDGEIAFVPGVEVTTYMPKFGHFGVFPYPTDRLPPPFKNTDVNKVFAGARAGDAKRALIVHHPRLTREIGYFAASGWKSGGPVPAGMRTDFDAVEVFNGYESASIERVETVLLDYYTLLNAGHRYAATGSSDSHRIQYQWAGYPRTMVRVGSTDAEAKAADPQLIVAAIKAGRATVTSGPILELELEGARPGGDVVAVSRAVIGRLVIRAAPWIDVTSANVIVGGRVMQTFDVKPRPTMTGPEVGTLEEAEARTVRLDAEVRVEIGVDPTWVIATARGTRTLDDVLPFMPIQPFAVTNPIFIHR